MSDNLIPKKASVGAQLGVGIKSAALYNPIKGKLERRENGWKEFCNDHLTIDLGKLRISSKRCAVEALARTARRNERTEVVDDGYYVNDEEFEDDESDQNNETIEHWGEASFSRWSWDSLSPVIPPNLQYFKKVELQRDYMYNVKSKLNSALDFVPEYLITDLSRSDLISSGQAGARLETKDSSSYDPTVGSLFIAGEIQTVPDLRNNSRPHRILVYSSGSDNSTLTIAVIDQKRDPKSASFDQIKSSISVELPSSIKSIKISDLSSMLGRKGDLIGVMTESSLHMIKIENISIHHEIKTSMCEPLPFREFGDFSFADFAFNPWDLRQFAVVDVKGNFGIGQMPKSFKIGNRCKVSNENTGTIFDPEELSNWKRIEWSSSFTRLLVMDRSKLIELDLARDWQLEVVQAKTWSSLLDYHRLDDDYGILLTSREIIVISTKQNDEHIAREISWKHDLNPEDRTLRLCVQPVKLGAQILLLVCIISRNHNKIYVQCFTINGKEALVESGENPILLEVPHVKAGLKEVCFYDRTGEEDLEFPARNSQSNIQLSMFINELGSRNSWHYVLTNDDLPINEIEMNPNNISTRSIAVSQQDQSYFPRVVPDLVNRICQASSAATNSKIDPMTESEVFQAYGYQLSEAINMILAEWSEPERSLAQLHSPLQSLATIPNNINNLSEFSSLLQQLSQHYTEQGVVFTTLKTISSMLLQEVAEDLDIFYSKLLQCWDLVTSNSEALTRDVINDVVMSTLHFCKPSHYKAAEGDLCESLEESYRDIIESWTEEDLPSAKDHDILSAFSQTQRFQESQSQIPTIKASQTRPSKRNKKATAGLSSGKVSKIAHSQPTLFNRDTMAAPPLLSASQLPSTLPDTMTPAFTLMQSSGSFSQSQSSQRLKRKKKKVGGFG